MSDEGLPQFVIIDLKNLKNKPDVFKCFGIYCWHAYPTNPKLVELLVSKDNSYYNSLGNFEVAQVILIFNIKKPGTQLFFIENFDMKKINYLKILVKETYGGNRTYINTLFIYDDFPESDSIINITDSRERNMPRKSDIIKDKKIVDDSQAINSNVTSSDNPANNIALSLSPLKNKIHNNNYILTSDNQFLLSDSELSLHEKRNNLSRFSDNANKIEEVEQAQENESNNRSPTRSRRDRTHSNILDREDFTDRDKQVTDRMTSNKYTDREMEDTNILKGFNNKYSKASSNNLSRYDDVDKNNNLPYKKKLPNLQLNDLTNMANNSNLIQTPVRHTTHTTHHTNTNNSVKIANKNEYKTLDEQLNQMQDTLKLLNINSVNSLKDNNLKLINSQYSTKKNLTLEDGFFFSNSNLSNNIVNYNKTNENNNLLENYLKVSTGGNDNSNNNAFNNVKSNVQIGLIEEKISNLENDVDSIKTQLNKLTNHVTEICDMKNMINKNNMNFVLDECKKMINTNLSNLNTVMNTNGVLENTMNNNFNNFKTTNYGSNFNSHINSPVNKCNSPNNVTNRHYNFNYDNFSQNKTDRDNFSNFVESHSPRKNIEFENQLNSKIEEKFDKMVYNLENKIFNSLLKPSVEKLENTLRSNFNEIKIHVTNIENNKKNIYTQRNFEKSCSKKTNDSKKIEKIKEIAEKLSSKLTLKEKMINKLQEEARKYDYQSQEINQSTNSINTFTNDRDLSEFKYNF